MSSNPPFTKGDTVISLTNEYSTARQGRTFIADRVYLARNGQWRFEVNHPKFGRTSYYCHKFTRVSWPSINTPNQEVHSMYFAVDITNVRPEQLDTFNLPRLIFGVSTSEDILKDQIRRELERHPDRRSAIFGLTTICETLGVPQIHFRDMRS